jgi:hypothetical protein
LLLAHLSDASCLETRREAFAEVSPDWAPLAAASPWARIPTRRNESQTKAFVDTISFRESITDDDDNDAEEDEEDEDEATAMSLMATR